MTTEWRIHELEAEIRSLRQELQEALDERDRARETATRLEQELNNPLNYIQVWR